LRFVNPESFGTAIKVLLPAASGLGALLILAYLLSIEHVPNFDLASFAATFFAAALFAAFTIVVISGFCLLPGTLARRIVVDARNESDRRDAESGVIHDADAPSFASLVQPRFVLLLSCLAPLPWMAVFHDSLRQALGQSWHAAITGYVLVLCAALAWLLAYGNARRKSWWLTGFTLFIGATSYIVVLAMLSQPAPDRSEAPGAAAAQTARDTGAPTRKPEVPASTPWQEKNQACIPILAAVVGISVAIFFRLGYRRWTGRRFKLPTFSFDARKVHVWRFDWTKIQAATVFLTLYSAIALASLSLATLGAPENEWFALAVAVLLFTFTNWIAFLASTPISVLGVLAFTGSIFFLIIPLWLHVPFMLPQLTARSLGLGAIRLEQITLDGKHCATLMRYGATCADKDAPLQLLDVNLLSRIGSSFVLELPIAVGTPQGNAEAAREQSPAQNGEKLSRIQLTVDAAVMNEAPRDQCDKLLAARAKSAAKRDSSRPTNTAYQCVRLIVPDGDVRNYVPGGPRTYAGRTAAVLEKREPATAKPLPALPQSAD